jgi:hypothetical protein
VTGPKLMPSEPPHFLSKKQPLNVDSYTPPISTRPRRFRRGLVFFVFRPELGFFRLGCPFAASYVDAFEIGSPMNVNPSEDPYFLSVSVTSWTVPIAFREGGSYPCGSGSLLRSTVMRSSLNQGSYVGNWPRD